MKTMDKAELEKANGAEGGPILVSFEGKVYDVTASKMWRKGVHFRTHQAGKDLTESMKAAPHGAEVLDRYEQIGTVAGYKAAAPEAVREPPFVIDKILRQHPHPVSVHFPIALSLTGALSMTAFLAARALGGPEFSIPALHATPQTFETFTLFCLILATLAAPVTIATGVLSWYYNYSAVWTGIYRWKTSLSILLATLQFSALAIRFGAVTGSDLGAPAYWLFAALVLAMAPTVIGLGYFGGKITFPR